LPPTLAAHTGGGANAGGVGNWARNRFDRWGEGGAQGDHAAKTAAVVLRLPIADLYRSVDRRHLRVHGFLERREIDKDLEKGAGLPLRLGDAIELAFGVVAAAHHGENGAVRSHCHKGGLSHSLGAAFGPKPTRDDAFGDALQIEIERGAQRQILGRGAYELLHIRTEHVDEIVCARRIVWWHPQGGRVLARRPRVSRGGGAVFAGGFGHRGRGGGRPLERAGGGKRGGRAHEPRQHRRLAQ